MSSTYTSGATGWLERLSPAWTYIHTQLGAGYRFDAEPAAGRDPLTQPPPHGP